VTTTRAWVLTPAVVSTLVPSAPGVYILGQARPGFLPVYAGRSDNDVRRCLSAHAREGAATHFTWRLCTDAREAFRQQCILYHLLRETHVLDNQRHPDTPARQLTACPLCQEVALHKPTRYSRQHPTRKTTPCSDQQ
jgi:hypothetical protein